MKKMLCWLIAGWWLFPNPLLHAKGKLPDGDERQGLKEYYLGHYLEAVSQYWWLFQQNPTDEKLIRDLGISLLDAGRFREAATLLQTTQLFKAELGEAYLLAGEFPKAREALLESLLSEGGHDYSKFLLGMMAYLEGQYAEAIEYFWQVSAENPRQASVHLMLARCFNSLAENARAPEANYFEQRSLEEYQRSIQLDESQWPVYRDLARWYESKGQLGKAIQNWRNLRSVLGEAAEIQQAISQLQAKTALPTVSPTAIPTTPPIMISAGPAIQPVAAEALTLTAQGPLIRVGLARNATQLVFGCVGEWRLRDGRQKIIFKGQARVSYRLELDKRGRWVIKHRDGSIVSVIRKTAVFEPLRTTTPMVVVNLLQSAGYSWSVGERKTTYFRGCLEVNLSRKNFIVVNAVSLEAYLLSVVPSEMPAEWPLEALKAQAIVARTDTLERRGVHNKQGYEVCNNAHCAAYHGILAENSRSSMAVKQTWGIVLEKDQHIIPTFYSHSCGGVTQSFQEAWSEKMPDPLQPGGVYDWPGNSPEARSLPLRPGELKQWLVTRPRVFSNAPQYSAGRNFRWIKIIQRQELSLADNYLYQIGDVQKLEVIERSPSGYVRKLLVTGTRGTKLVKSDAVRAALGSLRSNLFVLIPVPNPTDDSGLPWGWMVLGGGWGHGVGLCQVGAGEMGRQGYAAEQIVKHYFPQGDMVRWY